MNWWMSNASEQERACWKIIWNMEGPPKLKHFLWRACHGMLAVMDRLFYRHISPSKACRICGCDLKQSYIRSFGVSMPSTYASSLVDLLLWVAKKLDSHEFITFVTLAWASWVEYNAKVSSHRPIVPSIPSANAWSRPPEGWVKINVDAHLGEDGTMSVGVAVRNQSGKIILAAVRKVKAGWDVDMVGAYAACFGVQTAYRFGFQRVVLESDSLVVVRTIIAGPNGRTPIFLFFDDVQNLRNLLEAFICVHVKRGGNCLAHLIAREHVEVGSEHVWFDPIPPNFCNMADYDLI
ncbi:hypothetical protein RDABS01_010570 [Bienertia sinuspersici]